MPMRRQMIQLSDWCCLRYCRGAASRSLKLLGLLLCLGHLVAAADEADGPPALVTTSVTKAERDHREYRHLTLANQLKVLLIADEQVSTVSMVIDVAAGYHQDPVDASGTAALLAYSVLQEAPSVANNLALIEAAVDTQVNAEYTRFAISSQNAPAALFSLLPTLSGALTKPVLSESVFSRALTHTDADFQALLTDPEARRLDVYCALFNAAHPRARHCRARTRIERQEPAAIDEHLRQYHARYYRANNMTVVVRAALPLDVLETQLVKHLSELPTGGVEFEAPVPLVEPERLPLAVAIRTSAGPGHLHLSFPIPYVPEHLTHQPYSVATSLLEGKGQGSLLALLQELEWAENIQTNIAVISRHEGLFEIDIELTRLGVRAQDQIVALVFHLLEKIRGRGVNEWRYAELAQLARLAFRFDENPAANVALADIARRMHAIHAEDTLFAPYRFVAFNERLQNQYLSYLNSNNVIVSLSAPGIDSDQLSPMLAAPFSRSAQSAEQPDIKIAVRRKLSFPEANAFIPQRLNVKDVQLLPTPSATPGAEGEPVKILDKGQFKAWYLQDVEYNVPKAAIFVRIDNQLSGGSEAAAASTQLLAYLLQEKLQYELYQARAAGFAFDVVAQPLGLSVSLSGYSSLQGLMLTRLGQLMADARFDENQFAKARLRLLTEINNRQSMPRALIEQWYLSPTWTGEVIAQALEQLEFEAFDQFVRQFFEGSYLNAFFYGNLYRQEAQRLAALAEHYFSGAGSRAEPSRQVLTMPLSASDSVSDAAPRPPRHRQNIPKGVYLPASTGLPAARVYLQATDASPASHARMAVLMQLLQRHWQGQLSAENDTVQLAIEPLELMGYPGVLVSVTATRLSSNQLMGILQEMLASDLPLAAGPLAAAVNAVRLRWQQPPPTLAAKGHELWRVIDVHGADFSFRVKRLSALDTLTDEALTTTFRHVFQLPGRQFWLLGSDSAEAPIRQPPPRYRQSLDRYAVP